MPCGDLNQLQQQQHQHHHQHQLQQQQQHSCSSHQSKEIVNLNNLNQMMAAIPGGCGGVGQLHGSPSSSLHHHHHHLTVDVNLNHVMRPASQSVKSPVSPNPLDNANLRRQSTGLSAFNDYVDLVKRHLMYAVREEVEILKQQIGEMMERIGQLEYENTVLKSEAKPETLSKLLLPRVSQAGAQQQIQLSAGGGGGGAAVAAVGAAGVVVASQQQQQQQQSAVAQPQVQKPPTPSGQQTPAAMIPPQQSQAVPSGTATPTQQQQQQQQQHLVHQTSTPQPGQAPMS